MKLQVARRYAVQKCKCSFAIALPCNTQSAVDEIFILNDSGSRETSAIFWNSLFFAITYRIIGPCHQDILIPLNYQGQKHLKGKLCVPTGTHDTHM